MIRKATERDIARIVEIRNSVTENRLSDPGKITLDELRWFIANPGIFVWEQQGDVQGFCAGDPRNGNLWALFVDDAFAKRGIGTALLARACSVLEDAGHDRIWLTTDPKTRAERLYRQAGWELIGEKDDELLFELKLPGGST
ncbi:GNAT family N-acetyltransferase [Rhizobium azibense]|uniref:L-amino acid N-acyltransferase YncA n=1 Tax=Rhizobium azibense TaxID=1136135 RepID=A0A4R3RD27_9HYPH|nr:GNAT family N-acetyltransferase [Rhizobium azibense]TCU32394.1 L-amino acid N-acyltransferase YncA [Rhizobium azibense]